MMFLLDCSQRRSHSRRGFSPVFCVADSLTEPFLRFPFGAGISSALKPLKRFISLRRQLDHRAKATVRMREAAHRG